ncbi:hypothetical protein LUZ62_067514 [Rhynchospora pubera]|uniref:Integrase catalytic domain-containing protein n=1 Tax=Rhynchospora pubera TaxID=906938 RepID=A0AAV8CMX9_9POAL|nr:hypothetical protein LUZ62_067514 [Rhynchospora pubera]
MIENLLGTTIKILRTDNGTEYKPITKHFPQITHQTTCPYTPQQNGLSERRHRHIVELSLSTMSAAALPLNLWDEVFSSIVYLINRLPSSATSTIPYTTLFSKQPDYSLLRVLGCLCFPYTKPYNNNKLELRSLPCVFIGYATSQKGYRCLHIQTGRIFVSRHVIFDENSFPFKDQPTSIQTETNNNELHSLALLRLGESSSDNAPLATTGASPTDNVALATVNASPATTGASSPDNVPLQTVTFPINANFSPTDAQPTDIQPLLNPSNDSINIQTNTLQQADASGALSLSTPQQQQITSSTFQSHNMVTRTKDQTRRTKLFPGYVAYTSIITTEPTCFTQADKIKEWREAMSEEINALAKNNTWQLVPPPSNQKIIGCKWVYKLKQKSDGSIERHKARLVAKGFNQEEGVDFFDTYSPVVRPTTIRLILSLAISSNWGIKQLDVHNAFLHGDLQEKVYMAQPPGFIDASHPDHVCLLTKSLYGLKQAPRAWFQKLSTSLIEIGFVASSYDPSLFIAKHQNHTLFILVYVDDILVTGSSPQMISTCVHQLQQKFAVKDLGSLNFFLGIETHSKSNGILLTQTKYVGDLLARTKMLDAKPVTTPIATHITLSKDSGDPFAEPSLYRSVVGALQYATLTRPDIAYAVNKVSQFMHNPTDLHWAAVKRILRRSTSGFCIYFGRNLISWSAKKQVTVSRSSTEAEYRGLALTCTEILWIQFLLQELHVTLSHPPILWCDNIGATFLAANPMFHARTKHIEIDYHFVRERVTSKQLCVKFICSKDQLGDVMTKPLSTARFSFLKDKLNVLPNTLV